jgi:hypothetical protein
LCSSRFSHHGLIELGLIVPATITIDPRQCLSILVEFGQANRSEHGVRTGA